MYLWSPERVLIKRVIDGDTIEVELDLGFHIYCTKTLRLAKINCPERKDKEAWEKSKEFVDTKIFEKKTELDGRSFIFEQRQVKIITYKAGKFGRYLADIWVEGVHLNKELLEKGLAKPYGTGNNKSR